MNVRPKGVGIVGAAVCLGVSGLVGATIVGGGDTAPAFDASNSSTIALVDDRLWVTSPDDGSVTVGSPDRIETSDRIELGGSPTQLAAAGASVVVTDRSTSEVAIIERDDPAGPIRRVAVPCGGTDGVAALVGTADLVVATCPFDARAIVIDTARAAVVGWLSLGGRPAGISATADRVTIAGDADATLWSFDPSAFGSAGFVVDTSGRIELDADREVVWSPDERGVTMLRAVVATAPSDVAATYQSVDNDSDRVPGSDGSYGSLTEGNPRIEPMVSTRCGSRFAHFDGSDRELAGPVALAWDGAGERLWVLGRFTHTVSVLDCSAGGSPGDDVGVVATFRIGEGARGIVLAADGLTAYVDVGFDHSVAVLDLTDVSDTAPTVADDLATEMGRPPRETVRRPLGTVSLSADAVTGRRMFNDATDRHLSPTGVAACASCHLDGGDDGTTWRIATDEIPAKLRRTPPLWGLADGTKPLHWDGSIPDAARLSSDTIRNLLGGDGLLVDTSKIADYLAEIEAPPAAPTVDEPSVERGSVVFDRTCARCHAGESGTDGASHEINRTATDRDATLDAVVTPTLFGTRSRAPYLYDGSADTLETLFTGEIHGDVEPLAPGDRADLLNYLLTR